jgi:hypothetical protein
VALLQAALLRLRILGSRVPPIAMNHSSKRLLQLALIASVSACAAHETAPQPSTAPPPTATTPAPVATVPKDVVHFEDAAHRFAFDYPRVFDVAVHDERPTRDWRQQSTRSGTLLAQLTLPSEYQPKTNFSEAKLSVGVSSDPAAVAECTTAAAGGNGVETTQVTLHGRAFTKLAFSDAAAGNRYDTTSYRVVQDHACYTIEHTIHSTNLGNYSPDQGITAFDATRVQALLEGVVQSFELAPKP